MVRSHEWQPRRQRLDALQSMGYMHLRPAANIRMVHCVLRLGLQQLGIQKSRHLGTILFHPASCLRGEVVVVCDVVGAMGGPEGKCGAWAGFAQCDLFAVSGRCVCVACCYGGEASYGCVGGVSGLLTDDG